jgi:hypothetical protein
MRPGLGNLQNNFRTLQVAKARIREKKGIYFKMNTPQLAAAGMVRKPT